MISKGMVPATKDMIQNEKVLTADGEKYTNGKNYKLRHHGNLTTMDGLVQFRKMVAERDTKNGTKKSELQTDVIKYDYQLMDDAFWLLDSCGYKIFKRPDFDK